MHFTAFLEVAALLLPTAPQSGPSSVREVDSRERAELRQRIAMVAASALDEGVPGLSIAVGKDSEPWFVEGFGYADAARGAVATGDTAYRIGTLARQFTAVGILQLVEAEKIELEDDLSKLLPAVPAWAKKITLEQLLAGTSGIPSWREISGEEPAPAKAKAPSEAGKKTEDGKKEPAKEQREPGVLDPAQARAEDPRQDTEKGGISSSDPPWVREREILARLEGVEPEFPPGEGYSSESAGWLLLDLILERAAGQPLEDYVRTRMIEPLGLERTAFCPTESPRIRLADDCKHVEVETDPAIPVATPPEEAPRGLCSTAADMFRWTSALADGELLEEETTRRMWTAGTLKDGASTNAGFAATLGKLEQFRVVGHTGGIGGYAVRVAHYPEARATVVVLANCATAPVERMEEDIARALLGVLPVEPADLPIEEEDVARYAGTYMIATTRIRVFEKDGKLWWEDPAEAAFALLYQGRGVFVSAADRQTRFTFQGEDDEPAETVEVLRGGFMSTGKRVAQDSQGRLARIE